MKATIAIVAPRPVGIDNTGADALLASKRTRCHVIISTAAVFTGGAADADNVVGSSAGLATSSIFGREVLIACTTV